MWIPSASSYTYAVPACHRGSHICPAAATSSRTRCLGILTSSLCSHCTPSLTQSHNLLLLNALFTKSHVSIKQERTFPTLLLSHGIRISLNQHFWQSYVTASTALSSDPSRHCEHSLSTMVLLYTELCSNPAWELQIKGVHLLLGTEHQAAQTKSEILVQGLLSKQGTGHNIQYFLNAVKPSF